MAQLVYCEWLVEVVDADGDIHDVSHYDVATEARAAMRCDAGDGMRYEWGLVRDRYRRGDPDDLVNRQWAYVEDGNLPAEFDEGATMPKRYRDEYAEAVS